MQYSSHCSLRIDSWTVFCNRHNCYYSASSASLLLLVFQAGVDWAGWLVAAGFCPLSRQAVAQYSLAEYNGTTTPAHQPTVGLTRAGRAGEGRGAGSWG